MNRPPDRTTPTDPEAQVATPVPVMSRADPILIMVDPILEEGRERPDPDSDRVDAKLTLADPISTIGAPLTRIAPDPRNVADKGTITNVFIQTLSMVSSFRHF